jgi:hypothetical protein
MSGPTFLCINPDGSNAGVDAFFEYTITQYLDKAGSFDGKCAGDYSLAKEGWLDVLNAGKIVFRGFVDEVTEDEPQTVTGPGSQSIKAKDLWASLDEVFTQFQEYPALTTLNDMLSSDAPTVGKVIGLLWQLNSALPQGEASYTGANEIYVYAGYGNLSRCGTSAVYVDTTQLVLGSSATTLARGQYWRDAWNLYVRCQDGRDPRFWICSVTNYRDTRIRRGTISLGTSSFTVPYRIAGKSNFREIIERLILGKGLERELDHKAGTSAVLGLSYLNAKALVGRGSLTAPVSEFKADQVVEFHEESTGTAVNAIIGSGPGSGYSQVTVAKSNMMSRGHWRERTYSSSVLGELLTASLAKIWTDTSDARCWIAQDEDDLSLMPGDYVIVSPPKSQNLVKRAKKVTHKSDGSMTVEINQRILEPEDYMKAKASLLSDFNSFISSQKTSWSASFGPTNIDDSENVNAEFSGSAKFTVNIPAGTIDTEFATKFFLKMDIAAFEADLTTSETPAHDNGGQTGSHSGYGNKSTSAKTQDAHSVLQLTGAAYGGVNNTVASWGHIHGFSFSVSITSSGYFAGDCYVSASTHIGGCYGDTVVSGNGAGSGSTSSQSGATTVNPITHVHTLPAHATQAAAAQSHETPLEEAKTRTVSTEPKVDNLITQFKEMKESGNSVHYLDVYVTLNGNSISGSPYPNLYIGDEISDVDVTDQVIVGDNLIEVKIKEHYNSSIPVRCAVRGSLNSNYYIDPKSL